MAPNAATATAWGDKPSARWMKIRKCVPHRSGALLAIFDVEMASGTISADCG
jgi:hypothetical protein